MARELGKWMGCLRSTSESNAECHGAAQEEINTLGSAEQCKPGHRGILTALQPSLRASPCGNQAEQRAGKAGSHLTWVLLSLALSVSVTEEILLGRRARGFSGGILTAEPGLDTLRMFPLLLVPATLWDARVNQTLPRLLS